MNNGETTGMYNATVVIRTVDERTLDKCFEILAEMFHKQDIYVLRNITPFSEVVRQTFDIGINNEKKWTIAVDADMLVDCHQLKELLVLAEDLYERKKNFFSLNGMLFDKFWMENRVLGPHLYNTAMLPKAMKYISKSCKVLRPETFVKEMMQKHGYNWYVCNLCVGIHDFFQAYSSIYRKGILHSKKHEQLDKYYGIWKSLGSKEEDYWWICKGLEHGQKERNIMVDYAYFSKVIEKMDFPKQEEITLEEVEDAIKRYVIPAEKIYVYRPMSLENKIRRKLGVKEHKFDSSSKNNILI